MEKNEKKLEQQMMDEEYGSDLAGCLAVVLVVAAAFLVAGGILLFA